jgi:hypothetical protein
MFVINKNKNTIEAQKNTSKNTTITRETQFKLHYLRMKIFR